MSFNSSQRHTSYKNNSTIDGQVISDGKLVVKAQYLWSIQENTNWYCKQQPLQQHIIVPTLTITHPCIDVIIIRYVQDTPNNLCRKNQEIKAIQRHPIIMTDAAYDYIFDEIECHEKLILKGMWVLIVIRNIIDDKNNNAILYAVLLVSGTRTWVGIVMGGNLQRYVFPTCKKPTQVGIDHGEEPFPDRRVKKPSTWIPEAQ